MSANGDWRSLAEATANRLRLIQADLADEAAEVRAEHLADEVRHALEQVLPDERDRFLVAIEERFPAWESERASAPSLESAATVAPTDLAEYSDPSFLVTRLVSLAGGMSPEQRRAAAERLAGVGISAGSGDGMSAEAHERVRAALRLPEGASVDADRAGELLAVMLEQVLGLDQLVWKTWRQVAPDSSHRRKVDLPVTLGRFASGGGEVGREQAQEEIARFRQLTAALLASVSQAGHVAFRQMARLSPDEIEGFARAEKKWNESVEFACWRKYRELAGALDPATVESEIIRAIAEYAQGLMKPRGR